MKKHIFAIACAIAAGIAPMQGKNDSDAVLMTVDGKKVTVAEFEYLLNKNRSQQVEIQSPDDYLDLFVNFKLKVADAERAGMQNDPAFLKEYNQYRAELSEPYLRSKEALDSLVHRAYSHFGNDVLVSHIMLPDSPAGKAKAEEIRQSIADGKMTFTEAALEYSMDKSSGARGGLLGLIQAGAYPWAFEDAAYSTEPGKMSPVIYSGFGYHIVMPEDVVPAEGEINAAHILRKTMGLDEARTAGQKAKIDSLYALVKKGADFASLARQYSEDGSAMRGGDLGWFGRGRMVQPFDSIAFSLADGAVSEPFATEFGFHIIKRYAHRGVPAFDEARDGIIAAISQDERSLIPVQIKLKEFIARYDAKTDTALLAELKQQFLETGDSAFTAALASDSRIIASYNGKEIPVSAVASVLRPARGKNAYENFATAADAFLSASVREQARQDLETTDPDYRNLINEYRDGILLYNIANEKVWARAADDKAGLEEFFKANKAKYAWNEPKFKGYVFLATSDSIMKEALAYAPAISNLDPAEFTSGMRSKFGNDIRIERVIASKGENPIIDYLAFDGPMPETANSKWKSFASPAPRIITNPEEAADVKGAVVADYQAKLEQEWLEELHRKYKVKINRKVFNKLKSENVSL